MRNMGLSFSVVCIGLMLLCTSSTLAGYWEVGTVDNIEPANSSLAIVDGKPAIAYTESVSSPLKYAEFDGVEWNISTVRDAVPSYVHMAVINGQPAIVHREFSAPLRYTRYSGSAWESEVVDPSIGGGVRGLIDVNNQPAMARATANYTLEYITSNGTAWDITEVDDHVDVGAASLAMVAGQPAIAYVVEGSNPSEPNYYKIKFAHYNGSTWDISTITDGLYIGGSLSLAGIGDQPAITYTHQGTDDLMYAEFTGLVWDIEVVDSDGYMYSGRTSLVEYNARPAIAYHDGNSGLKYAEHDGQDWAIATIDSPSGAYPSLKIIDGNPAISYTAGGLKFATYVPEPATLGLLVIGGLAMLKRRK